MPAPGEQHKSAAGVNPFEEAKPHISEYTAIEIATLQSRLGKQLGPEYISSRPGAAGSKVHYITGEKCINLANEVFGFNGWSSSIRDIQVDYCEENTKTGKIDLGISVIVRVILKDGTFHEDVGYGHIKNCNEKAAAFEKCKKEATTDALKRALRNFGNLLGNCIYDKDYVTKVTKMKVQPSKWDADRLYRHPDYAPPKKEAVEDVETAKGLATSETSLESHVEGEDEFGLADFDDADFSVPHGEHPDEMVIEAPALPSHQVSRPTPQYPPDNGPLRDTGHPYVSDGRPQPPRMQSGASGLRSEPSAPSRAVPPPQSNSSSHRNGPVQGQPLNLPPSIRQTPRQTTTHAPPANNISANTIAASSDLRTKQLPAQAPSNHYAGVDSDSTPIIKFGEVPPNLDLPVMFTSGRDAGAIQNTLTIPPNLRPFNPAVESPSLRRTPGVDHTRSKPIGPGAQAVSTTNSPRGNLINPAADNARKIGMPPGASTGGGSPMQARGGVYKPPQMMKRPVPEDGPIGRPALGDVTNTTANGPPSVPGGFDGAADSKRVKLDESGLGVGAGVAKNESENGVVGV